VPVKPAIAHLQEQFLRMGQSGLSSFEALYGESGSGKTTFLETLPQFFDNLAVTPVPREDSLLDAIRYIREKGATATPGRFSLYYFSRRDNPTESDIELFSFFEALRDLFRDLPPQNLVIWPVTLEAQAARLHDLARKIGAESLLGEATIYYKFVGPPRDHFYSIADATARVFNRNLGLSDFGVDHEIGTSVLVTAPTLGAYFTKIQGLSNALATRVESVLREKSRPRVWILVAGDEATAVHHTVSQLTFGQERRLDVDRFFGAAADSRQRSLYLKDWEPLGNYIPYLLRLLDVRVIEIPPDLSLAVIRAFGDSAVREKLKQPAAPEDFALAKLTSSMLGSLLLGGPPAQLHAPHKSGSDTSEEYRRVQPLARRKKDALLHAPFATAIQRLIPDATILVGKTPPLLRDLQPDVFVAPSAAPTEPVCLEFTWRSRGGKSGNTNDVSEGVASAENETRENSNATQNTLQPGHIQQYVFQKVMQYVNSLGLKSIAVRKP